MRYTTGYHTDIVREVIKERGYKTIGFVLPETMPHKLVNGIVEGFDGLKVIDITEQIDRLIAIKSDPTSSTCCAARRRCRTRCSRRW